MSKTIIEVLATDAKYRTMGVKGDIYTLDKLKTNQDWTFDVPTLAKLDYRGEYKSQKYISEIKEFRKKYYKKHRFLKNVDLKNLDVDV